MCLLGQPGVKDSVLETAKARIEDTISSFVLYNGWCGDTDRSASTAALAVVAPSSRWPGSVAASCCTSSQTRTQTASRCRASPIPACSKNGKPPPKCPTCPEKQRGIMVTKVCDCPATTCTGTTGEPVDPGTPRAASLVAVLANLTGPEGRTARSVLPARGVRPRGFLPAPAQRAIVPLTAAHSASGGAHGTRLCQRDPARPLPGPGARVRR